MIVINLASTWDILRSVVVLNDATRDTMALEILGGPLRVPRLANASGSIAILIADSILVSRLLDKKTSSLLIECGRRGDAMYIGSETHWSLEGSLF